MAKTDLRSIRTVSLRQLSLLFTVRSRWSTWHAVISCIKLLFDVLCYEADSNQLYITDDIRTTWKVGSWCRIATWHTQPANVHFSKFITISDGNIAKGRSVCLSVRLLHWWSTPKQCKTSNYVYISQRTMRCYSCWCQKMPHFVVVVHPRMIALKCWKWNMINKPQNFGNRVRQESQYYSHTEVARGLSTGTEMGDLEWHWST